MQSHALVRTIYLYLFALLGPVLATIGGVRIVDLALKATVFRQAEDEQKHWQRQPPEPPLAEAREKLARMDAEPDSAITAAERRALREWLA
ncbi:MAG: hypothetical protein QUU85_04375, partial [Candidatus Eisenbacteria bacterium]|nr:hypothetical protein [Candidatus Eisenbacteria bacterium]